MAKKNKISWNRYEFGGFEWFRDNYDSEAIYLGKSDSTVPDIISPKYGKIDVKAPDAQCGEFTESKINDNEYNKYIANKKREEVTHEEANIWCRHYYQMKGISYFITSDRNSSNYRLMTLNEFFNTRICTMQLREKKQNGSQPLPKMYFKYIPKEWEYQIINGYPTVLDKSLYGVEFTFNDKKGQVCRMAPSKDERILGQIRKLGRTSSVTWGFSVAAPR